MGIEKSQVETKMLFYSEVCLCIQRISNVLCILKLFIVT